MGKFNLVILFSAISCHYAKKVVFLHAVRLNSSMTATRSPLNNRAVQDTDPTPAPPLQGRGVAGATVRRLYRLFKVDSISKYIERMEYMSQEGYDKLVAELRQMESVELPQVREAIAEARDKGDLSENFEYHAAKREQSRLLGRIRFKQRVLEHARVIDTSRLRSDTVGLLTKVEMTNLTKNDIMAYTIVSPHEANMREGKISVKSPIAQALLGKKVGDVVSVSVPAGILKLRIDSIKL